MVRNTSSTGSLPTHEFNVGKISFKPEDEINSAAASKFGLGPSTRDLTCSIVSAAPGLDILAAPVGEGVAAFKYIRNLGAFPPSTICLTTSILLL